MASSMKKSGPRVNNCRNFSVPSWAAEVPPVDDQAKVDRVDGQAKVDQMDGQAKVDPADARVKVVRVDGQAKAVAAAVLTAKECAPLC